MIYMRNFYQGDIWLTRVAFEDRGMWVYKARPVIIVGNRATMDQDIIIVPCTSQAARNDYDVLLLEWSIYGLPVPTVARIAKVQNVHKRHFIRWIDGLRSKDWSRIKRKLDKLF
ncbi:PemK-like, MazF-like toxin of type II toxin-antitoxin system [Laceyella sacchari]|nr:PemK-like, MazF-like toxin of type II toxin-antitoxin system [Laceyella sacchari]